ncbi:MAG: aminotransferase class III-fold pyridoxal phosphate-dependent enzyme, partial [Acidobacteria bacterium]|nr:aminotransferase class III-fold pyridoxal phosphate-dependent enzyme [Acidobacteriota bacterium]
TLRFVRSDLSSRLESATGPYGAYPDGTFTRENNASFRTHHNHSAITRAIVAQAGRLIHSSNLFHNEYQQALAKRLASMAGLTHGFFTNSGAEAIEVALKTAKASGRHEFVAIENGFHGRTSGALSITSDRKYRAPFEPLLPGVRFVAANDTKALRAAVSEKTAAIVVETIQGEGGVVPMTESYLREVRRLATDSAAMWIADETQCGLGRTGHHFAYQRFEGLVPDIITTAKPLAAGIPLGATIFGERAAALVSLGEHGSTFGGGPLACRVALAVLDEIDTLLPNIRSTGAYLHKRLSEFGLPIRGEGMMAGVQLDTPGGAIVEAAREKGLLINCTHDTVLRLLPPYIATTAHVDEAIEILRGLSEFRQRFAGHAEDRPLVLGLGA